MATLQLQIDSRFIGIKKFCLRAPDSVQPEQQVHISAIIDTDCDIVIDDHFYLGRLDSSRSISFESLKTLHYSWSLAEVFSNLRANNRLILRVQWQVVEKVEEGVGAVDAGTEDVMPFEVLAVNGEM